MKISLTVPTSLNDIKLSQYQKFIKVTKDSEDVDFVNRQLVSIFCNVPEDLVGKIKSNDFTDIIETVSKCLEVKPEFTTTFKLDGINYGFIPKLDDITVDEQSDIELLLKEIKTWGKACNVMYRPITSSNKGKYLISDYEADGKELDVPLDIALGAMGFFLRLQNDLLSYTLSCIGEEMERTPKMSQILAQSGGGFKTFTHFLEEVSSSLRMLES